MVQNFSNAVIFYSERSEKRIDFTMVRFLLV